MSLRDDLIAAKALIDTPEKRSAVGGFVGLLRPMQLSQYIGIKAHLCGLIDRAAYQDQALMLIDDMGQAEVMALFDRAIESAS